MLVGPYLLEDIGHLGAHLNLHSILHGGVKPSEFIKLPFVSCPIPELVLGRVYPIYTAQTEGVVCVSPGGLGFVRIHLGGQQVACPLDMFGRFVRDHGISFCPLVFRSYAVVHVEGSLHVLQKQPEVWEKDHLELEDWDDDFDVKIHKLSTDGQYLNEGGQYSFIHNGVATFIPWEGLGSALVPVGTYIVVAVEFLRDLFDCAMPHQTYVRGCLRYPNECEDAPASTNLVCVAFKVGGGVKVLCLDPSLCILWSRGVGEYATKIN